MESGIFDIIDPVDKKNFDTKADSSKYLLFNKVCFEKEELSSAKIAILGVGDNLLPVRKSLYSLYCSENIRIVDLGDLPEKKAGNLPKILKTLSDSNIFTILAGNSIDASEYCFDAMTNSADNSSLSASMIMPSVVQSNLPEAVRKHAKNLLNFNILGYQTYLSDPETLNFLSDNYFETFRLGSFREDNLVYEPPLRDSDIVIMDIASVKRSEAPDSTFSEINGLYTEEICKISRYAGMSDNVKLIHIFSKDKITKKGQISDLFAQIVWHTVDGYANRANEKMLNNVNGIKKIVVNFEAQKEVMVFYCSDRTRRWWMEIRDDLNNRTLYTACSRDDYELAKNGTPPIKWILYHQKLSSKI
ncbi:MAG: hypothetical protein LBG92_01650 [Prevotellaceae bacterium]|jgi:hypothetical protein|nr:hypothetical protein [Prevotellaceae bacterium]